MSHVLVAVAKNINIVVVKINKREGDYSARNV